MYQLSAKETSPMKLKIASDLFAFVVSFFILLEDICLYSSNKTYSEFPVN